MLDQWSAAGYERSSFGYPNGDPINDGRDLRQQFQNGVIHTPGTAIPLGGGLSLTYGVSAPGTLQSATLPNGISYSGPGFRVALRITPSRSLANVELSILDAQAPPQLKLVFGLPAGLSLRTSGRSIEIVDSAGRVVADIGGPIAADAAKTGLSLQTSVEGNQLVYQVGVAQSRPLPVTVLHNVASETTEDYNPYYRIGGYTSLVCGNNPYDCGRSVRAHFDSQEQSERHFPHHLGSSGPLYQDDQLDADRHCLWQAMTTEASNAEFASLLGDAHERDKYTTDDAAIMDQYNNITGRAVGLRNEGNVSGIISTCNSYADYARIINPEDIGSVDQSNPNANDLIALFAP
ncbi:LGFP repeat-containing protein [Rhodococcus rhodnii]|uniref:LGFP repeat-containing protein n=1 Tax=Rhodococcus rhodnii TaxID=38312 RepID=UPI001EE6DFF7|nr:hypothetical protein [Rhodococcus rhodnii]